MMDLERTRRDGLCQHCGLHIAAEQHMLRLNDGICKAYCSQQCRDQALTTFLARLVFQAPRSISLRDYILRSHNSKPI
jgi:hypothetical protein